MARATSDRMKEEFLAAARLVAQVIFRTPMRTIKPVGKYVAEAMESDTFQDPGETDEDTIERYAQEAWALYQHDQSKTGGAA